MYFKTYLSRLNMKFIRNAWMTRVNDFITSGGIKVFMGQIGPADAYQGPTCIYKHRPKPVLHLTWTLSFLLEHSPPNQCQAQSCLFSPQGRIGLSFLSLFWIFFINSILGLFELLVGLKKLLNYMYYFSGLETWFARYSQSDSDPALNINSHKIYKFSDPNSDLFSWKR